MLKIVFLIFYHCICSRGLLPNDNFGSGFLISLFPIRILEGKSFGALRIRLRIRNTAWLIDRSLLFFRQVHRGDGVCSHGDSLTREKRERSLDSSAGSVCRAYKIQLLVHDSCSSSNRFLPPLCLPAVSFRLENGSSARQMLSLL